VRQHLLLKLGNYDDVQGFGVGYSKFSLGFRHGRAIMKFRSRGTELILGWFPSGAYAKIDGLSDESLDDGPPPDPNDRKMLFTRNISTRLLIVNGRNLIIAIILVVLLLCLGNEGISTQISGLSRTVVANFDA
jgi:membrane-associated protease RseP (regulator of RpoE activity)